MGVVYGYRSLQPARFQLEPGVDAALPPVDAGASFNRLFPRVPVDTSGYGLTFPSKSWAPDATLEEIRTAWVRWAEESPVNLEQMQAAAEGRLTEQIPIIVARASNYMSQGKAIEAYDVLQYGREQLERENGHVRQALLASLIYFQGVASLRRGENENCVMCRGDSSCIVPISATAVHKNPAGSRQAIVHFTEYLEHFPDDLAVRWLLNVSHMTLGEYPDKVDPRYRLDLQPFLKSEFDIGRFRDVGHLVDVNRFNQAGGAVMDDFDGDGLFDLAVTSFDVKQQMDVYSNTGLGKFRKCTNEAGILGQLGGLNLVQADYNNDGLLDIFVIRGAWLDTPIRPSLLRNDGNFHFTDVTEEAGVLHPVNSNAAQWADFDNDGWLDLFVCCERQQHRLFHNRGNGTFEEIAERAGLLFDGQHFGKGCAWVDFDNDRYPDLYVNYLSGTGQLYHNERDGTFTNVTQLLERGGTQSGFSCWCWDFNNDGWLDIFASCYKRSVADVVSGLTGQPHSTASNKLFLNEQGRGFRDVTQTAGLDLVFSAMGSNFADFDNDGWLDFYLGTGEPDFGTLIPNRMFLNVGGERFSEITASAGVGHLQKGHGVACGDWNRDGNVDLFVETGGAVDGDKFHNVLFQNPGHDNAWVSLRLQGVKTNRSAIGARIRVITTGPDGRTIHRIVSSGSSFGGNPLEQLIGLGRATGIDRIEIDWPTSGTTQVLRDVPLNEVLQITEFEESFAVVSPEQPIAIPK